MDTRETPGKTGTASGTAAGTGTGDEAGASRIPGSHAGDQVGLGRVIEDHRDAVGSPDNGDPAGTTDAEVEEASQESFPASDPPTFTSDTATSRHPDRDAIELPSPRDVP